MISQDFGKDSQKQTGSAFRSYSLLGHVTKNNNHVPNISNHLCKSCKQRLDLNQTYNKQGLAQVNLVEVSLKS